MKNFRPNKKEERSDQHLLADYLKKRDPEILGILYGRHIHNVYGLCLKYFKNREDSQDAVMQIFEVIVKDIPKASIRNFKSWLYVVSKNYCLMQLRKQASKYGKITSLKDDNFMESAPVLHPLDEDPTEEMLMALQLCMDKLKQEQKVCVELFYYKRKCYREIADELKLEEKKIKSLIQNGKRNLKICIEKVSDEQQV